MSGYSPGNYIDYAGWLLVINERDGGFSEVGDVSGHWPRDIMVVSKHYSPNFLQFVDNSPHRFDLVWKSGRIRVYEIVDN